MKSFLQPLLRRTAVNCTIVNSRTSLILADHLIPAFDSAARRTGLLRHGGLPEGSAMIIAPSNAIHTFFMKFPIDVLFVAKDGRVVKGINFFLWNIISDINMHLNFFFQLVYIMTCVQQHPTKYSYKK